MLFSEQVSEGVSKNIIEGSDKGFGEEVIKASMQRLIVVDFYADWCGPCKQLTPLLEKMATEAKGALGLVKIDAGKHKLIASQLSVRSLPTVFAFYQGQPIDGFSGALPESKLRGFFDALLKKTGAGLQEDQPIDMWLEDARLAESQGDLGKASSLYSQILAKDSNHAMAIVGLASVRLAYGDIKKAKGFLMALAPEMHKNPEIAPLFARIELMEEVAGQAKQHSKLEKQHQQNPEDHKVFCDLALSCYDSNDIDKALSYLLDSIKKDRDALDGEACKLYRRILKTLRPNDSLLALGRKKLSAILFS